MNDVTDILVGVDRLLSEHGFSEMASARHQLSIAISLHKQQLQQARREGWEQAKWKAHNLAFAYGCSKAIAAMEYKEDV